MICLSLSACIPCIPGPSLSFRILNLESSFLCPSPQCLRICTAVCCLLLCCIRPLSRCFPGPAAVFLLLEFNDVHLSSMSSKNTHAQCPSTVIAVSHAQMWRTRRGRLLNLVYQVRTTTKMSPKGARTPPAPRSSGGSGKQQVVWALFASAAAGLSTYVYSQNKGPTSITSFPASYALCAEPGKVYTVDSTRPNADCILVNKANVHAVGTLGEYLSFCRES